MAGVKDIILEVTIKVRHNLEQGLESEPQEESFGPHEYTLSYLPKKEELDDLIQQAFSGERNFPMTKQVRQAIATINDKEALIRGEVEAVKLALGELLQGLNHPEKDRLSSIKEILSGHLESCQETYEKVKGDTTDSVDKTFCAARVRVLSELLGRLK